MVFTIDSIYKENSPRKEQWQSTVNTWTSGGASVLTVSPSTTPEDYALLVRSMKFHDNSLITAGTGSGMMELQYPDYMGTASKTYTFNTPADMKMQADKSLNLATDDFSFEMIFDPPILLKASNIVSDLVTQLPTDVTVSSGTFRYSFKGWTLKEQDFD